jgi:hypothetical protein
LKLSKEYTLIEAYQSLSMDNRKRLEGYMAALKEMDQA